MPLLPCTLIDPMYYQTCSMFLIWRVKMVRGFDVLKRQIRLCHFCVQDHHHFPIVLRIQTPGPPEDSRDLALPCLHLSPPVHWSLPGLLILPQTHSAWPVSSYLHFLFLCLPRSTLSLVSLLHFSHCFSLCPELITTDLRKANTNLSP